MKKNTKNVIRGLKKTAMLGMGVACVSASFDMCAESASGEKSVSAVFREIYANNGWWCRETDGAGNSTEIISGVGSTMLHTTRIRTELPQLLKELGVRKMMDIPCGDFHWMRSLDLSFLDLYIGVDIVSELIQTNAQKYAHEKRLFLVGDLTSDPMARVDLILCRDCLAHLANAYVWKAIKNIKNSGSKYLLATTFYTTEPNRDIATGDWRPLNLEKPPFNFPKPLRVVDEGWEDKVLALWKIADLPVAG